MNLIGINPSKLLLIYFHKLYFSGVRSWSFRVFKIWDTTLNNILPFYSYKEFAPL